MLETLNKINLRPRPFEVYTAETLWNDDHISGQMLEYHLNPEVEPASRPKVFVDRSASWIKERFDLGPSKTVCDFGCGPGLYTTPFARAGADVTGVDFSERSIQYSAKTAQENGLKIDYVRQNYLDFSTDRRFDLITMIYCDLCALSPEQRRIMLSKFASLLKPDGSVLLDVFSLAAYDQREESSSHEYRLMGGFWSADDYYGFSNTFKYDGEKVILDKYTIIEKSRTWEVYNWLQYFSLESLKKAFRESGLKIVETYANVAGDPYRSDSAEIAVVACRA